MPSVFKRQWLGRDGHTVTSQHYYLRYSKAGQRVIRKTSPATTSLRVAREQLAAALSGSVRYSPRVTVASILDDYSAYLSEFHSTTARSAPSIFKRLHRLYADRDVSSLTALDLELLLRDCTQLAVGTLNRQIACLRAAFRRAVEKRLIPDHPFCHVQDRKRTAYRTITWTDVELRQLCVNLPSTYVHLIWVLRHTGLRVGDAVNLRWSDIHDETLTVAQQKTGTRITVPLWPAAQTYFRKMGGGTGRMFPGATYRLFKRHFYFALKLARLEGRTVHDIRRTYAQEILEKTGNREAVSAFLGQSGTQLVPHYAQLRFDALSGIVRAQNDIKPS